MLGKTTSSPQHSDKQSSERGARQYLAFIMQNLKYLDNVRNGSKLREAATSLNLQRDPFTDKQKSFIDGIYEEVMKGYGLPSYKSMNRKHTIFTMKFGKR